MVHNRVQKAAIPFIVTALLMCALWSQSVIAAAPDPDMQGVWHGNVEITEDQIIKVELQFYKSEDGEDRLFIIIPEQDEVLAVEELILGKETIEFTHEDAGLSYKGTLKRGEKIEGTLTQNEQSFPITFILDTGNNKD